ALDGCCLHAENFCSVSPSSRGPTDDAAVTARSGRLELVDAFVPLLQRHRAITSGHSQRTWRGKGKLPQRKRVTEVGRRRPERRDPAWIWQKVNQTVPLRAKVLQPEPIHVGNGVT